MKWDRPRPKGEWDDWGKAVTKGSPKPKKKNLMVSHYDTWYKCTVCGEKKNGYHFMTKLGKSKKVCAKCNYKITGDTK